MVDDERGLPEGSGEEASGGEGGEGRNPHPRPLPQAGGEEEGPSTALGTNGEGDAPSGEAEPALDMKAEGLSVRAGKNRDMQVARKGKRKLFGKAERKAFLKWLAATGNVTFSAAKAGFCYQTVWKHRLKNPRFVEAMDRALDQGIVRAKARLMEDRAKKPIKIGCDIDESELEPPDPQVVMLLIREHERARAGVRKAGRTPRIATNAEVEKALVKRLALFAKRERARRAGGGGSD